MRGKWVDQRRPADVSATGGRAARRPMRWQAFVPDLIAELELQLGGPVAADVADAQAALAELHADEATAGLEVLARRLLRTEAVASSRIEAIEVSHRRLAEAEAGAPGQRYETARLVVGNVAAMSRGIELGADTSRKLTAADIESMHGLLMSDSPYTDDQQRAGRLRDGAVFIGGTSPVTAEFVPPPAELVPALVDDLMTFINERGDLSPVVVAAVAHAQFETIHPFHDGNGRVGRCLIHTILRRSGVTENVTAPVSVIIAGDGSRYVDALTAFRSGDVGAWISYLAVALTQAAGATRQFAADAAELRKRWIEGVNQRRHEHGRRRLRSDAALHRLVALLPEIPVLTTASVVDRLGIDWRTARDAIVELEDVGVLTQTSVGRRNRVHEARELFDLLNDFESAGGRGSAGHV